MAEFNNESEGEAEEPATPIPTPIPIPTPAPTFNGGSGGGGSLWDNDEALSSIATEKTVYPDESSEQMVRRMMEENAPMAAQRIFHIAMNSHNDNTSLSASKFIVEMVTNPDNGPTRAVWEKLVGDMVSDAELTANTPAAGSSG